MDPGSDIDPAKELDLVSDSGLDPTLLLDPVLSLDLPSSSASLLSMRVFDGSSVVPESPLAMPMSLPPDGFFFGLWSCGTCGGPRGCCGSGLGVEFWGSIGVRLCLTCLVPLIMMPIKKCFPQEDYKEGS